MRCQYFMKTIRSSGGSLWVKIIWCSSLYHRIYHHFDRKLNCFQIQIFKPIHLVKVSLQNVKFSNMFRYTSLGNKDNTKPNPLLLNTNNGGSQEYHPAWMLTDDSVERNGRSWSGKQCFYRHALWLIVAFSFVLIFCVSISVLFYSKSIHSFYALYNVVVFVNPNGLLLVFISWCIAEHLWTKDHKIVFCDETELCMEVCVWLYNV